MIATGTVPHRPDNIPFDDVTIIDSDGLLQIKQVPRSMIVIGAGVIGVEYATIFSALDAQITLVDTRNTILDFVDADIVDEFRHDLQSRGIQLRLGEEVERVEKRADGSVVTYLKSGKRIRSDLLMVASGRVGATADLDLDTAGLTADDRGRLKVQPTLPDRRAPHLRRRRRHRLPGAGLHLGRAGPARGLPCLRRPGGQRTGLLPARHLRRPGDQHRRQDRAAVAQGRRGLRNRRGAPARNGPRARSRACRRAC